MITQDVEQENLVVNSPTMKVNLLKVVSYPNIVEFLLSTIKKIHTTIVQMDQKHNVHHLVGLESITIADQTFVMKHKYLNKMGHARTVLLPQ